MPHALRSTSNYQTSIPAIASNGAKPIPPTIGDPGAAFVVCSAAPPLEVAVLEAFEVPSGRTLERTTVEVRVLGSGASDSSALVAVTEPDVRPPEDAGKSPFPLSESSPDDAEDGGIPLAALETLDATTVVVLAATLELAAATVVVVPAATLDAFAVAEVLAGGFVLDEISAPPLGAAPSQFAVPPSLTTMPTPALASPNPLSL